MKRYLRTFLLALALAAAACAPDGPAEDASRNEAGQSQAPAEQGSAAGTGGMQAMPGMQGGGTADRMRAHMGAMRGAGGDSLMAMLPVHRQMAANLVAEFNREMREMNMAGDAAWNATVDSLRRDLVRMPKMSGTELRGFMPAHEARLQRFMEMHRSMMANMKM